MEQNTLIIYNRKIYSKATKRAVKNLLLGIKGDDPEQYYLRLIPVPRKKAIHMPNPFIQDYAEVRDIYLVDMNIGQKDGKDQWKPWAKIAVDPELLKQEMENLG